MSKRLGSGPEPTLFNAKMYVHHLRDWRMGNLNNSIKYLVECLSSVKLKITPKDVGLTLKDLKSLSQKHQKQLRSFFA